MASGLQWLLGFDGDDSTVCQVDGPSGEFDPRLCVYVDEDFIFRLSPHTALCHVNSPLVLTDRTPHRPELLTEIKSCREYEALKLRQVTFEKWLRLSKGFDGNLQATIHDHWGRVYSEQVNWLLINCRNAEVRRAAALASRTKSKPGILAKWGPVTVAPALARRLVIQRSRQREKQGLYTAPHHDGTKDFIPASLPKR